MVNDDEFSLEGEISRTMKEINECRGSEKDPCDAFSDMAKRLESSHVSSFVSLIVQNSRKGKQNWLKVFECRLQYTEMTERMLPGNWERRRPR